MARLFEYLNLLYQNLKQNVMESFIQLLLILSFTALIYFLVVSIRRANKMAKLKPVHFKKDDLVLFKNRYHQVLSFTNGKYALKCLDSYGTLVLNVERNQIERRVL